MNQLQFLKIEQNPITFPPAEIVEFSGQDMDVWLGNLKAFLLSSQSMIDKVLGLLNLKLVLDLWLTFGLFGFSIGF